jgi:hypothetical protein
MSKQIGLIKVKGKLDDVSFYQKDGQNYVRMAKGPSKNRIMTDPAFQRTRENNREFGGSIMAAKAFRKALTPVLKFADRKLGGRSMKVFKSINSKAEGIRGQRPIKLSSHGAVLQKFEINSKLELAAVFKAPFTLEHTANRTSGTLKVPAFSPLQHIYAVPGATHFRLIHVVATVSDYYFDPTLAKYAAVNPTQDSLNAIAQTDYLPLSNANVAEQNLIASLPAEVVLPAETTALQGIGIEFYQNIGAEFYPLSQDCAFSIMEVF